MKCSKETSCVRCLLGSGFADSYNNNLNLGLSVTPFREPTNAACFFRQYITRLVPGSQLPPYYFRGTPKENVPLCLG
jgi:hypothetical protein